jgi:GTP-binding protein HflX
LSEVHGNTLGIKASQRRALERTYRRKVAPEEVVSLELARHLCSLSHELGRQVGVLLGREGNVREVIVGDASQLEIPEIGRLRGGAGRFRGLRLVHTHLRGESLTHDDLNDLALLRLDLVAMIEVEEDGSPGRIELAHLAPVIDDLTAAATGGDRDLPQNGDGDAPFVRIAAPSLHQLDFDFEATIRALEAELSRRVRARPGTPERERALVIGVAHDDARFEETLELVRSADVEIAGTVRQRRGRIHPGTVVGKGKLTEIVLEGMRRGASVAVFDINLRPAQARAFEDETGRDRARGRQAANPRSHPQARGGDRTAVAPARRAPPPAA